jgi:hypothetical protein
VLGRIRRFGRRFGHGFGHGFGRGFGRRLGAARGRVTPIPLARQAVGGWWGWLVMQLVIGILLAGAVAG